MSTGKRIEGAIGCPSWCRPLLPLFHFLCSILKANPLHYESCINIPARLREWLFQILRRCEIFGWAAGHFESDSQNLAGMYFHNSVDCSTPAALAYDEGFLSEMPKRPRPTCEVTLSVRSSCTTSPTTTTTSSSRPVGTSTTPRGRSPPAPSWAPRRRRQT